jgi:cytochrome c-type biogenesis protein CcmE
MNRRQKTFAFIVAGVAGLGIAVGLVLYALRGNVSLYYTPTQVFEKQAPIGRTFRIGGLVVDHSLIHDSNGLTVHFKVTDTDKTMPVVFTGILPDLFKEGKGVVAEGKLESDGVFHASQVLAKHDANYMPPEAKEALAEAKKAKAKEAAAKAALAGTK